jgi:hypothetical protein
MLVPRRRTFWSGSMLWLSLRQNRRNCLSDMLRSTNPTHSPTRAEPERTFPIAA